MSWTRAAASGLSAILLAFAPASAGAQTLQDELRLLLTTHPRIKASASTAEAAGEGVRRAFAEFLPRLVVSGDAGHEHIDSPARRTNQGEPSDLPRNKQTLTLSQTIFDGFRNIEGHRAATGRKDAADQNLAATRQGILLEGINAYYNVLRQAKLLEIARENENVVRQQLQLEDERVSRGSGIAVDVLFAKTRLQLARERTVQLEGAVKEAVARYVQVFDHRPEVARMVDPDLDLSFLPQKVSDAVEIAMTQNPGLRASDRQVEVASRQIGVQTAEYMPRFDLVGALNREEGVDTVAGVRREWSVLVRMSWELFSGFATSANVAAATHEKASAMDTHRHNQRKVIEDLQIAWDALMTARERVALLENAAVIAEEVFTARRRLRDAGRETALNVLDAQSEVFNARQNLIAASYDAQTTAFRVLHAMGMLSPENLKL